MTEPGGSVVIVGISPPDTAVMFPDDADTAALAASVDAAARPIAQLLWNHIGRASFAGLEPFTLEPRPVALHQRHGRPAGMSPKKRPVTP